MYIIWKKFPVAKVTLKRLGFIYYNNIILYIFDNTHILPIPPMNANHTTQKNGVQNKSQPSDPCIHYRNRALCRAPAAHGKDRNTHGTAFVVRILPKRTAKGARRIFTR
jgi:hypothetical protein